jgi:hypothetical protein
VLLPWGLVNRVPPDATYARPSVGDWVLLAIGSGFVALGIFIFPSHHDVGIVTISFFGLCAVTFADTIVRKLRFRRLRPLHAEIVGGVPIRPSKLVLGRLSASIFVFGVLLVRFGGSYGAGFVCIAWLLLVLLLWVDDLDAVESRPPRYRDKVKKHLARSERWVGAHVMLMTSQYRSTSSFSRARSRVI